MQDRSLFSRIAPARVFLFSLSFWAAGYVDVDPALAASESPTRSSRREPSAVLWPEASVQSQSVASAYYRSVLWNYLGPAQKTASCIMLVESGLGGAEYSVYLELRNRSASVVSKRARRELRALVTEALETASGKSCRDDAVKFGAEDVDTKETQIPLDTAKQLAGLCEEVLLRVGYGESTTAVYPSIHFSTYSDSFGLMQGQMSENGTAKAFRSLEETLSDYAGTGRASAEMNRKVMKAATEVRRLLRGNPER